MADDKKPSADEIVDNLAEEMGVKDEKPEDSRDDLAADLGGLFGVTSKKKKKKRPVEEPVATAVAKEPSVADAISEAIEDSLAEDSEGEDEVVAPEKTEEKVKEKVEKAPVADKPKKSGPSGIDGIFSTGSGSQDAVVFDNDPYLDEDDLGGASAGRSNMGLIAVIAVLVVALVGVVLATTDAGKNIMLVFKGEYRAQRDADIAAKEEAFKAEQEAALPKFGTLSITGSPKYATLKLNGEQKYGETSAGWREMQLNPGYSTFTNLPVKEKHIIEVSSPGFETRTFEMTEGVWQGGQGGMYNYALTATLVPSTPFAQNEFDARMGSDTENEFYGKMVINSVPAGATVTFNNKPLLNEKGEQLKTPVTFEKAYAKNEKEGSKDFGKLEELPVRVDTVFDVGHKLELSFPEQPTMPKYVAQIERQLWTCNRKSEDDIKKLAKDHVLQAECDYVFNKTVDFNQLKGYIERQEQERKKIEEYNKKIKELRAKQKDGKAIDATELETVEKK